MKLLNEVTHVRLDRENLQVIDGLELLGSSVKNLYLQHVSWQFIGSSIEKKEIEKKE